MKHFWNFITATDPDEGEGRILRLDGAISDETWFGDEITPQIFRDELKSASGPLTVVIISPGGDVFAAAEIYNELRDYGSTVTVMIDGLAASAASVIAMAGDEVIMSPVSMMMIHNPATVAIGDGAEMLRAKAMLDEVKESIINAYERKTHLSRTKISRLMDNESWFNANKAVELGFADCIDDGFTIDTAPPSALFSRSAVTNSLMGKLGKVKPPMERERVPDKNTKTVEALSERLDLILGGIYNV
jgi:ATP-dependent Clp protease protease subunit